MVLKYFKIGEVAELLQTTVRTIRYYEEEQLLEPTELTAEPAYTPSNTSIA